MGWLEDVVRVYKKECKDCGKTYNYKMMLKEFDNTPNDCTDCGATLSYAGFENVPAEEGGYNPKQHPIIESYDQNGRKAIKIGDTYMSKTKYNYLETGKIEHEYTDAFKEVVQKETQKQVAASLKQTEKLLKTKKEMRV